MLFHHLDVCWCQAAWTKGAAEVLLIAQHKATSFTFTKALDMREVSGDEWGKDSPPDSSWVSVPNGKAYHMALSVSYATHLIPPQPVL